VTRRAIASQICLKNEIRVLCRQLVQIQGVIESCADILTTSYWLNVEL
jgi:hypothetical protein